MSLKPSYVFSRFARDVNRNEMFRNEREKGSIPRGRWHPGFSGKSENLICYRTYLAHPQELSQIRLRFLARSPLVLRSSAQVE